MPHARGALSENQQRSPETQIWTFTRFIKGRFAGGEHPCFDHDLKFSELFCRAQRRAEIAEFVIDLVWSFDGLSNFFAEQRAIAFA
jgi:hypothetical protein